MYACISNIYMYDHMYNVHWILFTHIFIYKFYPNEFHAIQIIKKQILAITITTKQEFVANFIRLLLCLLACVFVCFLCYSIFFPIHIHIYIFARYARTHTHYTHFTFVFVVMIIQLVQLYYPTYYLTMIIQRHSYI